MDHAMTARIVDDFEQGRISRRQMVTRLMGFGAAMASLQGTAWAQAAESAEGGTARPMFQATGLDHIALDVTDVARSRQFYQQHLGLSVVRGRGDDSSFLGAEGRDFCLALFRADEPKMNHYCYALEHYDPDSAAARLTAAGITPRRTGNRLYFPDPDGLTVQITG